MRHSYTIEEYTQRGWGVDVDEGIARLGSGRIEDGGDECEGRVGSEHGRVIKGESEGFSSFWAGEFKWYRGECSCDGLGGWEIEVRKRQWVGYGFP